MSAPLPDAKPPPQPSQIQISPRMLCACGKTARVLTNEERDAYEEAIRKMERREAEADPKANELVNC